LQAFAPHQPFQHAALENYFEDAAEDVALAEPAVTVLGERRVIRDRFIQTQPTEPAIGQVQVHLVAKTALRSNAKRVADDQHPDHQHWIDRGPTRVAVKRSELPTQLA
jgi:hypothetical protein